MAALPVEEKADELIQEAVVKSWVEQLPRVTGDQILMRDIMATMPDIRELS